MGRTWLDVLVRDGVILVSCRITRTWDPFFDELALKFRALDIEQVEELVSLPCPVPLFHRSQEHIFCPNQLFLSEKAFSSNVVNFKRTGLAIIPEIVSQSEVFELLTESKNRIEQADKAMAKLGINIGIDTVKFEEISSRGKFRFDLLFDLNQAKAVQKLAKTGPWLPFIQQLLEIETEEDFTTAVSVVYSRPKAEDQGWHADGPHVDQAADWTTPTAASPYAICVFLPLVDLSPTVGFTQFWIGSHQHLGVVGFGPASLMLGGEIDGIVNSGGCVIYDYRLIHRGMANLSEDIERPILQFLYHRKSYVEDKNYGVRKLFKNMD